MTDSVADLRDELRTLLLRIGSEARKTIFMFSDAIARVPGALPVLMGVLKSGCPASLFGDKDKDYVANQIRPQVADAGIGDNRCATVIVCSAPREPRGATHAWRLDSSRPRRIVLLRGREAIWDFFTSRVSRLLHVIYCVSPVDGKLRESCEQYPALLSCCIPVWFLPWPEESLQRVAVGVLDEVPFESSELRRSCSHHLSFVYESVNAAIACGATRHTLYNTPVWFYELIRQFSALLTHERRRLAERRTRLENGLQMLSSIDNSAREMRGGSDVGMVAAAGVPLDTPSTTKLLSLKQSFKKALFQSKLEASQARASLATRMSGELKQERTRWGEQLARLKEAEHLVVGDCLLAAAFLAYAGPFPPAERARLLTEVWLPDISARGIPVDARAAPMRMLSGEAATAQWHTEGLPADACSEENATVVKMSERWPLMIDPQQQAVSWLAEHEKASGVIRWSMDTSSWPEMLMRAIEDGLPIILENMDEVPDTRIFAVLFRLWVPRGGKLYVSIGDRQVEVHCQSSVDGAGAPVADADEQDESAAMHVSTSTPLFRLFLQTRQSTPHFGAELQVRAVRSALLVLRA